MTCRNWSFEVNAVDGDNRSLACDQMANVSIKAAMEERWTVLEA